MPGPLTSSSRMNLQPASSRAVRIARTVLRRSASPRSNRATVSADTCAAPANHARPKPMRRGPFGTVPSAIRNLVPSPLGQRVRFGSEADLSAARWIGPLGARSGHHAVRESEYPEYIVWRRCGDWGCALTLCRGRPGPRPEWNLHDWEHVMDEPEPMQIICPSSTRLRDLERVAS
jgi:hypothetical protein